MLIARWVESINVLPVATAGIAKTIMKATTSCAQTKSGMRLSDIPGARSLNTVTMMFLFAVPIMLGLGVYLVPLMLGTRNLAFPRLNAFSYYVYLIGGLFLYTAFFLNTGPDAGWFAYVPLSGPQFSPGKRVDVWAQMITFTEISALAVAVNLITTIFKQRAPGMSLNRIPLFVWAMLVTSFMVVFAMPAVML